MRDLLTWLPLGVAAAPLLACLPVGRAPGRWTAAVGIVTALAAAALLAGMELRPESAWATVPWPAELGGPQPLAPRRWTALFAVGIAAAWALNAAAAGRGQGANPAAFALSATSLLGMCFVESPRLLAALAGAGTLAEVWQVRRGHGGQGWAIAQLFATLLLAAGAVGGDRLPAVPEAWSGFAVPTAASAAWLLGLALRHVPPAPVGETPWTAWPLLAGPAATALLAARLGPTLATGRVHEFLLLVPAALAAWHAAGAAFAHERWRGVEHAAAAFGNLLLLAALLPAGAGVLPGMALAGGGAVLALALSGDGFTRRLAGAAAAGLALGTLPALAWLATQLDAAGRGAGDPWLTRAALALVVGACGLLAVFGIRRANAFDAPGDRVGPVRLLAGLAAFVALPMWWGELVAPWLEAGAAPGDFAGHAAPSAARAVGAGWLRWRATAACGAAALLGAALGTLRRLPDWTWTDGVEIGGRLAAWAGAALRGLEAGGEAVLSWGSGRALVAPQRRDGAGWLVAPWAGLLAAAALALGMVCWRMRG